MPYLKVFNQMLLITLAMITISFAGCPDYSHQRPVPDYQNMIDGGAGSEQVR